MKMKYPIEPTIMKVSRVRCYEERKHSTEDEDKTRTFVDNLINPLSVKASFYKVDKTTDSNGENHGRC